MIKYRNKTRKRIDQFSVRIQLTEGFFVKYANAIERKVMGRHSPHKTVPRLRERNFIRFHQLRRNQDHRNSVLYVKNCALV
jgi:hypothetical protein